jgi:hypothetical protein
MLRIIFLLLITSASFGQVLQETNGSRAENRIVHKLGFRLPQVCWVTGNPNLLNYSAFMSKGAMVYDTCAGKIKRWSGSAWISVADSMATGDTTGLGALYIRNTTTHEDKRFSVQSGRLDSILAASSAGLSMYSNSGTQVGLFGAGGGSGATFYGGVNIDGTTRLNTGLTGVLIGTSGTVSATANKMVSTFAKNATRDSAILTLADGTRLAVRDSVGGGGGTPGGGTYSIQYNRAGAFAGNSNFVYDTVNAKVGIGTASPAAVLSINSNLALGLNSGISVTNTFSGTSAYATLNLYNNNSDLSQIFLTSTAFTPALSIRAAGTGWTNNGAGGLSFLANNDNANSVITFSTGTAATERMRVNSTGAQITGGLSARTGALTATAAADELLSLKGAATHTGTFLSLKSSTNAEFAFFKANGTSSTPNWYIGGSLNNVADPSNSAISAGAFIAYNASTTNFYGTGVAAIRSSKYDVWFQTGSVNGGGYRFYTEGTNERLTIFSGGNVGVNSGSTDVASAQLHVTSTTKGFLPPRMNAGQRNAIASPASGLEVTNTSLQNHPNFYNGTAWLGTNQQVGNEAITGNKTIAATTGTHLHMIDATSGNVTITLPTMAAGYVGVEYQFIRTDGSANTVTIQRAGSNTINNAATSFTIAQFERAYVIGVNNSNTFTWHAGKLTNY